MRSIWSLVLLGSLITYHCLTTVSGEEAQKAVDASQPTFDQCKPFVDAALKTSSPSEGEDGESNEDGGGTEEETSAEDQNKPPDSGEGDDGASTEEDSAPPEEEDSQEQNTAEEESGEDVATASEEESAEPSSENIAEDNEGDASSETNEEKDSQGDEANSEEKGDGESEEAVTEEDKATEEEAAASNESAEADAPAADTEETTEDLTEGDSGENKEDGESGEAAVASNEDTNEETAGDSAEEDGGEKTSAEETGEEASAEDSKEEDQKTEEDDKSTDGDTQEDSGEEEQQSESDGAVSGDVANEADQSDSGESQEATKEDQDSAENAGSTETEADAVSDEEKEPSTGEEEGESNETQEEKATESTEEEDSSEAASVEEEEEEEVEPYEPRSRDHITQILGLDDSEQTKTTFNLLDKVTQQTLKELKATYANSIQPLEQLYKYRDLSNRHFGDPEIFSKPLIVFMGPWSGGKSTIINWLLGIQHEEYALRTGADPSPAQFNILMHGEAHEKLDGTQLAATWSFSGLQKFGQSFLDRLSGQKLPNRLLEKINVIEIPGILEVRKNVDKTFPFNDACQWFIDRADTLFLIYDPAKLDIGPETEAILDQLKGRESQVRIVLNKADTVKPDELLRVQAMLVWNISPLMSSAEPPVLYAASLWDRPLQKESPKSLLVAHENHFLKDIRDGIEKRVETRIAAARRFAVRIRNHAKMIDCYLNTYNNHRSFFSDRKKISTDIIDHPQNYHIYEGLSTLTNISRYDLPDPESYQQFFRMNPLWDFPTLSSTCSFWKGCPLHKLDIAIAYELPEILGKFRRQREAIVSAKSSSKN